MTTDTDKRLAEIRGRAEKATEGPWMVCSDSPSYAIAAGQSRPVQTANQNNFRRSGTSEQHLGIQYHADANFIAHSRTDIPFLLAEIERRDKAMIQFFRWLDDASEPYPSILTDYSQSKQGKMG